MWRQLSRTLLPLPMMAHLLESAGVFMKLVAAASIRPGEEILWHYQLCPSQHAKPARVAVKYFYDLALSRHGLNLFSGRAGLEVHSL